MASRQTKGDPIRPLTRQVERARALAARVLPVSPSWREILIQALDLGLDTLDGQIADPNPDAAE